jgi:hypothetical protein
VAEQAGEAGSSAEAEGSGKLQRVYRHRRYTKDHQIVIAHNNWTSYLAGERWVVSSIFCRSTASAF